VAHLVSQGLAAAGDEVLVLAGARERSEAGRERRWGLTIHRLWTPAPAPLRLYLSLAHPLALVQVRRIALAFRPDVVHAHNVHERLSFASLGAARAGGAPLVLTAHDYLLFCLTKFLCSNGMVDYTAAPAACAYCRHIRRVPRRNALVRGIVRRHAAVIACISRAQRRALAANGFAGMPLEVVYNGIDPRLALPASDASAAARAFRARHGIDGRPLVLFGGRISGAKGGDQLVRALAHVRRRVDGQLAICGDRPSYFDHARRLAAELGLEASALHTLGWLEEDELNRAFAAADVCATPSVYPDPFNLMTLRAMAHGKPVVGTCYGATPELVVDGETGLIADPWRPDEFGDRLADLLADPDLARKMGEAGRRRVETEFTLERQLAGYRSLFERCLSGRVHAAAR
jgi:glycosyltransferase involved in cell wall biosynthesis